MQGRTLAIFSSGSGVAARVLPYNARQWDPLMPRMVLVDIKHTTRTLRHTLYSRIMPSPCGHITGCISRWIRTINTNEREIRTGPATRLQNSAFEALHNQKLATVTRANGTATMQTVKQKQAFCA